MTAETRQKVKYETEVFNPKLPIFVKKSFKGSGRNWLPGQRFDWKTLSMDQRRVRIMFEQRWLTHNDPDFTEADEVEDQKIDVLNKDDLSASLSVVARGGGWFDVHDAEGNAVNDKPLRKDDAEALAAGHQQ